MRRIIKLISLLSLFLSMNAVAQSRYTEPGCWFGDLGLEGYYYSYREKSSIDNSFFMQHKGPMYGIYYSLGYQPECWNLRFALEGQLSWGDSLKYKSRDTGISNHNEYLRAENRLLGYYPYRFPNGWALEPYSGLGYRWLENDGSRNVSSTRHCGYLRESRYRYLPIGARLIKEIACDTYLIGHLEYDVFLGGTQRSRVDGLVKHKQRKGFGARAGIDLYIPSCFENFDYLVGAFIRHWNIKDSTLDRGASGRFWSEPRNKTYEIGLKAGLVF